ncbi:unnamed protein product [Cylindrotheca closterium]|uniref:Uncharacterized protein n=1 Tax=Cylindrotheca closterium TaxID=2856 RepID=A0AAD2G068_9STRA|nr:unnamed protein product [Cylindrotheca closterium]
MTEGNSTDKKDDDERLKKLMKAATGCDNVDEVRKKTLVARDSMSVDSAKEFLTGMEDDDENVGVNRNAGGKPKVIAPSPKDDEVLKTLSLSGPAPKPPTPRTVVHPPSAQAMPSSDDNLETLDQRSTLIDSSTPQQHIPSSEQKEQNLTRKTSSTIIMPTDSRDSDLDYTWISRIYALGSLLSLVFYLLEKYGSRPQKSFVANLNDVYIVFLPYIPCLVWTLLRLNQRRKESVPTTDTAKKEQ